MYSVSQVWVHPFFVNILLYIFMWQQWRNDTLLQCKVVSVLSDCATSILIMWFDAFLMSIPTPTLNLPVHTYSYPKLTLKKCKYIIGSTIW